MKPLILSSLLTLLAACGSSMSPGVDRDKGDAPIFSRENIKAFGIKGTKRIALTFDDGPRRGSTERILDVLKANDIRATFFTLGGHVAGKESILTRMAREGHIIGNHSRTHADLTKVEYVKSPSKVIEEILSTHQAIEPFQDPLKRLYFRAPYGLWTGSHADHLNSHKVLANYIGPIYWNAGGDMKFDGDKILKAADWACWSKKISVEKCAEGYVREIDSLGGGVVLMHDIHDDTATMLPIVIRELKAKGYKFVTLDQLPELHEWD